VETFISGIIDGILDRLIFGWLRDMLIQANMAAFEGMFIFANNQLDNAAYNVAHTPYSWNPAIFNMVRGLSETIILPIAGLILTFVVGCEFIQIIMDRNNMHEFDGWIIMKWVLKTTFAIIIITNAWPMIMGVFDVAAIVVANSSGYIDSNVTLGGGAALSAFEAQLNQMNIGQLTMMLLQTSVAAIGMAIMGIVIMIVIWGRMLEIYLMTSLAPIPLATISNREWGQMGNNFIKSLCALAFQGFLIMVCIAIYAVVLDGLVPVGGNASTTLWSLLGFTALLCFMLIKTGSIAKSIFSAS
jgi:hypothetical protein